MLWPLLSREPVADLTAPWIVCDEVDTSSDLLLAQMLQLEMDAEHDQQLKREENKWNGSSKGQYLQLQNVVWRASAIDIILISNLLTTDGKNI